MDDELRARQASSGDHPRTDDAAGRSIPFGSSGSCATSAREHVHVLLNKRQLSLDPQGFYGLDSGSGPGGPEAGQEHDGRE
jgi:hypothetical protein